MPDPRCPVVCCRDRACGRELNRAERHAFTDQKGDCDECWSLRLEAVALPVPPRVPSGVFAAATAVYRMPDVTVTPGGVGWQPERETVRAPATAQTKGRAA